MTESQLLREALSEKDDFITKLMNELRESYLTQDDLLEQLKVLENHFKQIKLNIEKLTNTFSLR